MRIYQLAIDIFEINYEKYLEVTERVLLGVAINSEKREYEHLFGDLPDNFLSTINKQFVDAIAGYRVDVGAHFPELGIKADVFLLNVRNIHDSEKEIDSLLIHELCHMVLDSKGLSGAKVSADVKDQYHGDKLYKKTNTKNENITKHTKEFCDLLSAASEIASKTYPVFQDRWDVINNAMRYDFKVDSRQ